MGLESAKANMRRQHDPLFHHVFAGKGIDIGAGGDNVARDGIFKKIVECESFDVGQGNAQSILDHRRAGSYDFVYSSHCLEHMHYPIRAIDEWFALLRPGGFLIVVVPDEDLYEQGVFPSRFNQDHKWTFTIYKGRSWSTKSINVVSLIAGLPKHEIILLHRADTRYDHSVKDQDQTAPWPGAEANIEFVVRKA